MKRQMILMLASIQHNSVYASRFIHVQVFQIFEKLSQTVCSWT